MAAEQNAAGLAALSVSTLERMRPNCDLGPPGNYAELEPSGSAPGGLV